MGRQTYSTLLRAAGIGNATEEPEHLETESPPPPVPDKGNLRVDMPFLNAGQAATPTQTRSASPHVHASGRFLGSLRNASPISPLMASPSFFRSRAGSSASKAPPPPLTLHTAKRKGSLPILDARTSASSACPEQRLRSASLPLDSLDPFGRQRLEPIPKATHLPLSHSLPELPLPPPTQRLYNPRSTTATPQEELLSVYDGLDTKAEANVAPDSPPLTGVSNARASSILSISQDTAKHRLDMLARRLGDKQALPIAPPSFNGESKQLDRNSLAFSSCSRSEAHSVPHDAVPVPQTPMVAQLSLPIPMTANTESSFDLGTVPFTMVGPNKMPSPPGQPQAAPAFRLSHVSSGSGSAPGSRKGKDAARSGSGRSARPKRVVSKRSVKALIAPAPIEIASLRSETQTADHTPSLSPSSARHPSLQPRPFPWKTIKVSEARKKCSPQQLQKLVLESMREYSSASSNQPGLLLEGFESLPLEIEQCGLRLKEVEEALSRAIEERRSVLAEHVTHLSDRTDDDRTALAGKLISAINNSEQLAEEARMLREHLTRVEQLREGHWRATAALSLSRLNSSYLKAKDKAAAQAVEVEELKAEREALLSELAETKAALAAATASQSPVLSADKARASALSVPLSSAIQTPATSAFDYSSFPAPPSMHLTAKLVLPPAVPKQDMGFLTLPTARGGGSQKKALGSERSPPLSPAPQTPSTASHYSSHTGNEQYAERYSKQMANRSQEYDLPKTPASTISPQPLEAYKFPQSPALTAQSRLSVSVAAPEWAFCSLPTPPLSVVDGSVELRSASSASSVASSRFKTLKGRLFGSTSSAATSHVAFTPVIAAQRSQSTPPPDSSDLPWLKVGSPAKSESSVQTAVRIPVRSMSTPDLDPHANALRADGTGVETLRFVPPSLHLGGAVDDEEILSLRSAPLASPASFVSKTRAKKRHGRMYSDASDFDGASADRVSLFALEKLEIVSLLSSATSLRAAGGSPVSDSDRLKAGTPSSMASVGARSWKDQ